VVSQEVFTAELVKVGYSTKKFQNLIKYTEKTVTSVNRIGGKAKKILNPGHICSVQGVFI
jgi:hypothetical protein